MKKTLAAWFDLGRHDIRTQVPAAIRAIVQNGLVEATFKQALVPDFLYPRVSDLEPVASGIGDTLTKTRRGLLTPTTTALGGNTDPTPSTYSVEQFSLVLDQYAGAIDTNILQSAVAAQKKYLEDVAALGTQSAQSLNRISRGRLFAAYGGGTTFIPTGGGSSTTLVVDDANGFAQVLVNGVPTAVSATNPLNITINGVANTVTGCNLATNTLTLGTASGVTTTGWVVAAANAPTIVRAGSRTSQYTLTAGDVATFALFRSAVARLRQQAVPTVDGYYVAHIDAVTEAQLFNDADFKQALQGRVDSPVFRDLSIGRFGGIDWVRNIEAPAPTKTLGAGSLTVRRALVVGAGALIGGQFMDEANLLDQVAEAGVQTQAARDISLVQAGDTGFQVAMIVREPQDRLGQIIGTAWSWVGDFCVPSDSVTGDAALYKRGVVVEHIGA